MRRVKSGAVAELRVVESLEEGAVVDRELPLVFGPRGTAETQTLVTSVVGVPKIVRLVPSVRLRANRVD